jgi:aspartyl/glutamyl-tRNA(Asn/Gln) amidotransferase C subunit
MQQENFEKLCHLTKITFNSDEEKRLCLSSISQTLDLFSQLSRAELDSTKSISINNVQRLRSDQPTPQIRSSILKNNPNQMESFLFTVPTIL